MLCDLPKLLQRFCMTVFFVWKSERFKIWNPTANHSKILQNNRCNLHCQVLLDISGILKRMQQSIESEALRTIRTAIPIHLRPDYLKRHRDQ